MFDDIDWIVIPGGPGLSANYMKYGFVGAFVGYKLHYYDPIGSPENKAQHTPSIDDLVEQILTIIVEKKIRRPGFITHSFGNYLAMRVIEKSKVNIEGLIMISPMPLLAKHYQTALQNICSRIPDECFKKIKKLSKDIDNGPEIFKILFPYYATMPVEKLPDIPFDTNMCNQISGQAGDYDDTNVLSSCNIPWVCIVGEHDPFYIEKKLFQQNILLIPGVGHYPFYENRTAFIEATKKIKESL